MLRFHNYRLCNFLLSFFSVFFISPFVSPPYPSTYLPFIQTVASVLLSPSVLALVDDADLEVRRQVVLAMAALLHHRPQLVAEGQAAVRATYHAVFLWRQIMCGM